MEQSVDNSLVNFLILSSRLVTTNLATVANCAFDPSNYMIHDLIPMQFVCLLNGFGEFKHGCALGSQLMFDPSYPSMVNLETTWIKIPSVVKLHHTPSDGVI